MASFGGRLRSHASVPLYRNAYALMLSSGATSALGLLYWVLASRSYSPSVVGYSSSAIAALMFVTGLASLYLDGSLVRFIPRAGPLTPRLVLSSYAVAVSVSVVVSVVFVAGIDLWAPRLNFLGSTWTWFAACVIATMASCVFTLQDAVLTGLRRTTWVPVENTVYALAKIVLLVALAGAATGTGILISWVAPLLLVIPPVSLLLVRLVREHMAARDTEVEEVTVRRIVRYAGGNYAGYLCLLAYTRLPPLLVLNAAGSAASAFFYLPWTIAGTLMLLTINISVSLIVEATVDHANARLHIRRAAVHAGRLIVPVVIALLIAAPYVLHLFGERYAEEGSSLLRVLAVAALPNAVCVMAFGVARLQDRVRTLVLGQIALAVLVLGLSALLLPPMGIDGVGVAWLISQTVVGTWLGLELLLPLWRSGTAAGAKAASI